MMFSQPWQSYARVYKDVIVGKIFEYYSILRVQCYNMIYRELTTECVLRKTNTLPYLQLKTV